MTAEVWMLASCCHLAAVETKEEIGTVGFVGETVAVEAAEAPNVCSLGTTCVVAAVFGEVAAADAALKSSVVVLVVLVVAALNFAAATAKELVATGFVVAGSSAIG